jgi:hydroxymethylpyrimidine/phosphomethylpyrimidine kinase
MTLPCGPWLVVVVGADFGKNATASQVRNTPFVQYWRRFPVRQWHHDALTCCRITTTMPRSAPVSVLTVAGSDSGGGAGIQADLKTFQAHGVHGTSAITAVTAQNTRAVTAVHGLPSRHIHAQIQALLDDFRIAAWKTGMLADARTIRAVAGAMRAAAPLPYVLDPVMIATSGAALLQAGAVTALRRELLPLASLVTPNLPEAAALSGLPARTTADLDAIAACLGDMGAAAVLIKGGHQSGARVVDRLYFKGEKHQFVHRRLARNGHGTGCTLAAAITANLGLGFDLVDACARATDYVHRALAAAYRPGRGPVDVLDYATAAMPAQGRGTEGKRK